MRRKAGRFLGPRGEAFESASRHTAPLEAGGDRQRGEGGAPDRQADHTRRHGRLADAQPAVEHPAAEQLFYREAG